MARPRSILAAAAAAGLLASSGCDYWRNLTQDVTADRGRVVITVQDALTGERMPDAVCGREGGEMFEADDDGVIARDDMPTGKYLLVCRSPKYHVRALPFELELREGKTKAQTVQLVRLGGDDWYPEHPERQVRLQVLRENGKYPGPIVFKAYREDSTGRLIYKWTSNLHPGQVPPRSSISICSLYTARSSLDSQELRIELSVDFQPEGDTALYPVKTIRYGMTLKRNSLPRITLSTPFWTERFCPDQSIAELYLGYDAVDPIDEECERVKVTSSNPASPVGLIDTVLPCGEVRLPIRLTPRFQTVTGPSRIRNSKFSYIRFEAVDANGESVAAVDTVEAVTNLDPEIRMFHLDTGAYVFPRKTVKCSLYVTDADAERVQSVDLDWGDGIVRRYDVGLDQPLPLRSVYTHEYTAAGDYRIKATVRDRPCKAAASDSTTVSVRENSAPRFESITQGFNLSTGEFKLYVKAWDEDIRHGLDSNALHVQWAYPAPDPDSTYPGKIGKQVGREIAHAYDVGGTESEFRILLTLTDGHEASAETLLTVPRSVAIRNLPPPKPPAPLPLASPAQE